MIMQRARRWLTFCNVSFSARTTLSLIEAAAKDSQGKARQGQARRGLFHCTALFRWQASLYAHVTAELLPLPPRPRPFRTWSIADWLDCSCGWHFDWYQFNALLYLNALCNFECIELLANEMNWGGDVLGVCVPKWKGEGESLMEREREREATFVANFAKNGAQTNLLSKATANNSQRRPHKGGIAR